MIDPVIFSEIFGITSPCVGMAYRDDRDHRWLVIVEREIKRRAKRATASGTLLVWVLPVGILGHAFGMC